MLEEEEEIIAEIHRLGGLQAVLRLLMGASGETRPRRAQAVGMHRVGLAAALLNCAVSSRRSLESRASDKAIESLGIENTLRKHFCKHIDDIWKGWRLCIWRTVVDVLPGEFVPGGIRRKQRILKLQAEFEDSEEESEEDENEGGGGEENGDVHYSTINAVHDEQVRLNILHVLRDIGDDLEAAGVADKLLDVITGAIVDRDFECCQHLSRALAVGLHRSGALCHELAGMAWATRFLALAFPSRAWGGVGLIVMSRKGNTIKKKTERQQEPPQSDGRYNEMRENALSCLCSITKVSRAASKNLDAAGGLQHLINLALDEEEAMSGIVALGAPGTRGGSGTGFQLDSPVATNPSAHRRQAPSFYTIPTPPARQFGRGEIVPIKRPLTTDYPARTRFRGKPAALPRGSASSRPDTAAARIGKGQSGDQGGSGPKLEEGAVESEGKEPWDAEGLGVGDPEKALASGGSESPGSSAGVAHAGNDEGSRRRVLLAARCLLNVLSHRRSQCLMSTTGARGVHEAKEADPATQERTESFSVEAGDRTDRMGSVGRRCSRSSKRSRSKKPIGDAPCGRSNSRSRKRAAPRGKQTQRERQRTNGEAQAVCSPVSDHRDVESPDVRRSAAGNADHPPVDNETEPAKPPAPETQAGAPMAGYAALATPEVFDQALELLRTPSFLHQELALALVENGLERVDSEQRSGNTFSKPRVKRRRLRIMSSGCLRALCWLMMHSRRGVAEGSARVLRSVMSGGALFEDNWAAAMVEQGCIPILRMIAGTSSPVSPLSNRSDPRSATRFGVDAALVPPETWMRSENNINQDAPVEFSPGMETVQSTDSPSASGSGRKAEGDTDSRMLGEPRLTSRGIGETAEVLLSAIFKRVRAGHLESLLSVVAGSSSNRGLKANVVIGLVLLSVAEDGDFGNQFRRCLASSEMIPTTLGMLRSPASRSAGLSFLGTLGALLEDLPQPVDSPHDLPGAAETKSDVFGSRSQIRVIPADEVVWIRDPLGATDDDGQERQLEDAEGQGIKMACPPREVMCGISPVLCRLITSQHLPRLPVLHGRYSLWEEAMAHIGAPHTIPASVVGYSTPFLLEMFTLAADYEIKGIADSYALELWRRQHKALEIGDDDGELYTKKKMEAGKTLKAENGVLHDGGTTGSTTESTGESCTLSRVYGGGNLQEATEETKLIRGSMKLEEGRHEVKAPIHGAHPIVPDPVPVCAPASTPVDRSHLKKSPPTKAGASPPGALSLLEAGLRTQHAWLCTNAFRQTVAGLDGDGRKGLPAKPRELASLLSLLGEFVSKLLKTT